MADKHYNAESRLLRCSFHLTDAAISVSRKNREKPEWSFALADLIPTPERIRRRFPMLVCFPLSLVAVLAWATWRLALRYPTYEEPTLLFGGALTLSALFHAYRGILPVEFARFLKKDGAIAFDIAKGDQQALAFEYFVEEIQQRIRNQASVKSPPV